MSKKTPQNEQQLQFFNEIISNGGNIPAAAKVAGYVREYAYELARKYKDYLLERVEEALCLEGVRAARVMSDTLTDTGEVPGGQLRLTAAQQILDRIGVTKQERIKLDVTTPNGIFILPAKDISHDTEDTNKK